jgi:hypothetical protein
METIDIIWLFITIISFISSFIMFLRRHKVKINRVIQLLIVFLCTIILPVIYGSIWLKYNYRNLELLFYQKICIIILMISFNFIGICILWGIKWIIIQIKNWLCGEGKDLF